MLLLPAPINMPFSQTLIHLKQALLGLQDTFEAMACGLAAMGMVCLLVSVAAGRPLSIGELRGSAALDMVQLYPGKHVRLLPASEKQPCGDACLCS